MGSCTTIQKKAKVGGSSKKKPQPQENRNTKPLRDPLKNSPAKTGKQEEFGIYNNPNQKCLFFNHSPLRSCPFLYQKFKDSDGKPTQVSLGFMLTNCKIDIQMKCVNLRYINSTKMKIWLIYGGIEKVSATGLTTEIVSYKQFEKIDIQKASRDQKDGDLATFKLSVKPVESVLLILQPLIADDQSIYSIYRFQILPEEKEYIQITQTLQWSSLSFRINDIYGSEQLFKTNDANQFCSICLTSRCESILLPCRHMCLCEVCTAQVEKTMTKCPLCRKQYYSIIRYQLDN